MQGKTDSGLKFAQGSHRDISANFHARSRNEDLSKRGYSVASVGEALSCMLDKAQHKACSIGMRLLYLKKSSERCCLDADAAPAHARTQDQLRCVSLTGGCTDVMPLPFSSAQCNCRR